MLLPHPCRAPVPDLLPVDRVIVAVARRLATLPTEQVLAVLVYLVQSRGIDLSKLCIRCTARQESYRERQREARPRDQPRAEQQAQGGAQGGTEPPAPTRDVSKSSSTNKHRETALEVLHFLNEKTGHAYRPVETNLRLIEARLASGVAKSDLRRVISLKVRQWETNPEMRKYLRPSTLFSALKFEQYFGECTLTITSESEDGNG